MDASTGCFQGVKGWNMTHVGVADTPICDGPGARWVCPFAALILSHVIIDVTT